MIFDRKRKAWGAVAVGSAGALLVLGSALPASASSSTTAADPIQTYEPDTSLVSASEQAEAESVVAVFVAVNPVPEHTPGSSDSDFAAYNDELETYWNTVPWESVMEQWGCTLTETPTVSVQTTGFGTETVVLEEGHICGDNAIAAPAAGIVESRSVILDDEGIAFADSTLPSDGGVSTQGTGYGTNVTLSLNRPVLGQIRASTTYTGSGSALAFIRLGQSSLSSCTAGTQLATGGSGIWVNGTSRSVTASVNQNANWSNGWQRDRGSGYTNEGRYCELI